MTFNLLHDLVTESFTIHNIGILDHKTIEHKCSHNQKPNSLKINLLVVAIKFPKYHLSYTKKS